MERWREHGDVRLWHLADNPVAPAVVRFWTKADKRGFWPATVCPLLTQTDALANAGADTRIIQDYLGHKSIEHAVKYTRLHPTKFDNLWR
jgi:integrase